MHDGAEEKNSLCFFFITPTPHNTTMPFIGMPWNVGKAKGEFENSILNLPTPPESNCVVMQSRCIFCVVSHYCWITVWCMKRTSETTHLLFFMFKLVTLTSTSLPKSNWKH